MARWSNYKTALLIELELYREAEVLWNSSKKNHKCANKNTTLAETVNCDIQEVKNDVFHVIL